MGLPKALKLCVHSHGAKRIDRLSRLCDKVIHRIFSFLDYNDLARVQAVSKRFNLLVLVSPYLFFKPNFNCNDSNICDKINNFEDYLRTMIHRRRAQILLSPIVSIRLHWFSNNNPDHNFFLYGLIKLACEGQLLQELDITIIMDGENTNFLAWENLIRECRRSLRVLRLTCLYSNNNNFLTRLTSDHTMLLHTLTLNSLSMSDLTGYKLNITSATLQILEISDVYTSLKCDLNINCVALKSLRMKDVSFSYDSHLQVTCPSLKELTMKGCHFFKGASILIEAEALVLFNYESRRDRHSVLAKELFKLYAPILRDVTIITSKKLPLNTSTLSQGLIKQLQTFITLFVKSSKHDPAGYVLMSTPSLKTLSIEGTNWVCKITDPELFRLFRSNPRMVNDECNFKSILEEKARSKTIRFFNLVPR